MVARRGACFAVEVGVAVAEQGGDGAGVAFSGSAHEGREPRGISRVAVGIFAKDKHAGFPSMPNAVGPPCENGRRAKEPTGPGAALWMPARAQGGQARAFGFVDGQEQIADDLGVAIGACINHREAERVKWLCAVLRKIVRK